jgi:hypothetical protein
VSAALTAAAISHKLPVFAIIPRVTPLPELDAIQNLQFKYRTTAWHAKLLWGRHDLRVENLYSTLK